MFAPARLLRATARTSLCAPTSVSDARNGSDVLERLILQDRLAVEGAVYSIEIGEVAFFDGVAR